MTRPIARELEETVRYEKTGPIFGMIGALILFGVAGFFWSVIDWRPIDEWPLFAYWFILGPGVVGGWIFATRLIRLVDRSPKLIIKPEGIVLCEHGPAVIAWDRILRARFSRSTENGHETSAYVTLVYLDECGYRREAALRADRLTRSSGEIVNVIKQRANLSSV